MLAVEQEIVALIRDCCNLVVKMSDVETFTKSLTCLNTLYASGKMPVPRIRIVELNEDNFKSWKFKFECELEYYQLDLFINSQPPNEMLTNEIFLKFDKLTKNQIGMNISDRLREIVISETTAYSMYQKVIQQFEGSNENKCVKELSKIFDLVEQKCSDLEKVVSTIKQVRDVFKHFDSADPDLIWRSILLKSLPECHSGLRTFLNQIDESDGKKKFEKYCSCALTEHQMSGDKAKSVDKRMMGNNINKHNGKPGPFCWYCKQKGHPKSECPKLKNRNNQTGSQPSSSNGNNSTHSTGQRSSSNNQRFQNNSNKRNNGLTIEPLNTDSQQIDEQIDERRMFCARLSLHS